MSARLISLLCVLALVGATTGAAAQVSRSKPSRTNNAESLRTKTTDDEKRKPEVARPLRANTRVDPSDRRRVIVDPRRGSTAAEEGATSPATPRRRRAGPSEQPFLAQPEGSPRPPAPARSAQPGSTLVAASDTPETILVAAESSSRAERIERTVQRMGYAVRSRSVLEYLGFIKLVLGPPAGVSLSDAVLQLRRVIPSAAIDINDIVELQGIVNHGTREYARSAIGWRKSMERCRATRIGVIDTPVNLRHPALSGVRITRRSFVRNGVAPATTDHGTAISTLLVGRAGERGFRGLLPNAPLYVASVFERSNRGRPSAEMTGILRALDWLGRSNVEVANLSFAGRRNIVLRLAVRRAVARGMILVAAAGNGGPRARPKFPAAYRSVVAVTATDVRRAIFQGANRGEYVEIAAPGVDVWTPKVSRSGAYASGTSYAVPFVVAVAAVFRGRLPRSTIQEFRSHLRRTAVDLGPAGRDPVFGWGLLQAPDRCSQRGELADND